MDLNQIGIRHAALSDTLVLARFGKDPEVALDHRDIEHEVMAALVTHMFWDMEDARTVGKEFSIGDEKYQLVVERL